MINISDIYRTVATEYYNDPSEYSILMSDASIQDAGNCRRGIYYRIKCVPPTDKFPLYSLRAKISRKNIIDTEQSFLKSYNPRIVINQPLKFTMNSLYTKTNENIKFDVNGILHAFSEDMKLAVLYSVVANIGMKEIQEKGPKDKDLLHCFMLYEAIKNCGIEYLTLIYIDRSNYHDFSVKIKSDNMHPVVEDEVIEKITIKEIHARFTELALYLQKNILPPKDYTDTFQCKYCLWRTLCQQS